MNSGIQVADIASQAGHWYGSDGTPAYHIEGKNGRLRATTLRDARKLNLYPSVTTILKTAAKPQLELWKQRQVMLAALTLTRKPGETDDEFCDRVLHDSKQQAARAAERGSACHGAIERAIQGLDVAPEFVEHVNAVFDACLHEGIDLYQGEAEKSFAHPAGFAGKCDWHSKSYPGGIVLDFKTTERIKDTTKPYDEHGMQLSAYALGFTIHTARRFNVFVGLEDRQVRVFELPKEEAWRHQEQFLALLKYWQLANDYHPGAHNVTPS